MSSFSDGMKMGSGIYNTAMEQQRQQVLDDRATRDDEQKQTAYQRQLGIQAKSDAARTRIEGLDGGVFEGSQANFGINDGVAPQGPMPAEAYQAPSVGLQPRKATQREYNQAYQAEATARGDMTAAAGFQAKDRGYGVQEITDTASKTPISDIRGSLGNLNIGAMTGMPISYIGEKTDSKGKNNGYNFVTYDGAGKPSPFTLNEDQLRQMHVGSQLSAAGYGAESHQVMSAVNKEAADRVKDYNDNMYKQVGSNNQGQYYSDNIEQQRAQLAETARGHNMAAARGGDDKKIPAELQAQINDTIGKLNTTNDPKERQRLGLVLNNLQVSAANATGKTVMQKPERGFDIDPGKYGSAIKTFVDMGVPLADATMKVDGMLGRGPGQGMNPTSAADPFNVANADKQPKPAVKGLVKPAPQPEPYAGAGAPPQYISGGRGGVIKMANPQYQQWLMQNGLGIPQMPTGNVTPYAQD